MHAMMRYVRAVITAIRLTMQGKQLPYQPLLEWIDHGQALVNTVLTVADEDGLNKAKREQITVHVDGREQSMEITLSAVKYHLESEYPYLLHNMTEHSITAIYASNMNDQHALNQLRQVQAFGSVKATQAIVALSEHLNNIPPSTTLGSG